jgi:hypothetical protein
MFGYTYFLSYFASLSGVEHCALLSGVVLLNVIFAVQNRWFTFFMFLLSPSSQTQVFTIINASFCTKILGETTLTSL